MKITEALAPVVVHGSELSAGLGAQRVEAQQVCLTLPSRPVSFYRHGWQSWSLSAWTPPTPLPLQRPAILHPMQSDPSYVREVRPHGSSVAAVELTDGDVLLVGGLDTDAHVVLADETLRAEYESEAGTWFIARGTRESVFAAYAAALRESLGAARGKPNRRVWCSWYSLYTLIDERLLHEVVRGLEGLPFDVLQVDDGWQAKIGDWTPNKKFPSGMPAMAERIRATGREPGLWLAPLTAVRSSQLFRDHPEWFLRDGAQGLVSAGFNWSEPLYALDTTIGAVQDWLSALMHEVRGWGFSYLKLDFLFAGALPGKRKNGQPREAAYRDALRLMRDAIGSDGYLLACGAPVIPSLGLCDALRIGPDVAAEWENERDARQLYNLAMPGARNAIRTTVSRLWLRELVQVDPDVVYFRSKECSLTTDEKQLLQDLAMVCNFRATSDLPQWLTAAERGALLDFLQRTPEVVHVGEARFRIGGRVVDFRPYLTLPAPPAGLQRIAAGVVGWAASLPIVLQIFDWISRLSLRKLRQTL